MKQKNLLKPFALLYLFFMYDALFQIIDSMCITYRAKIFSRPFDEHKNQYLQIRYLQFQPFVDPYAIVF